MSLRGQNQCTDLDKLKEVTSKNHSSLHRF